VDVFIFYTASKPHIQKNILKWNFDYNIQDNVILMFLDAHLNREAYNTGMSMRG